MPRIAAVPLFYHISFFDDLFKPSVSLPYTFFPSLLSPRLVSLYFPPPAVYIKKKRKSKIVRKGERVLEQDLRLFFLLLGRLHLLQGPRGALRISSLTEPPRASSSPPRLGSRLASPIRYNGDLFSFLISEREESQSLAIYGGEKIIYI